MIIYVILIFLGINLSSLEVVLGFEEMEKFKSDEKVRREVIQFQEGISKGVRVYNKETAEDKSRNLSLVYNQGPNLIYDCVRQFWACVDVESYRYCKNNREKAKSLEKERFPCAIIFQFEKLDECFEKQQKMVDANIDKVFCSKTASD